MKTISLTVQLKFVNRNPESEKSEAPSHPAPVLSLNGVCSVVDQTEHKETVLELTGDLFKVMTFSAAFECPSLMTKKDVAQYVKENMTFDFPPCSANGFWESIEVKVSG